MTNSAGLCEERINGYKHAISELFNKVIFSASNGEYRGNVVFHHNNPEIIQSLDFGIFGDDSFGGQTSFMSSSIHLGWIILLNGHSLKIPS